MVMRIAIAAFDGSTYLNPAILDAGSTVRYVVLDNSYPGAGAQQAVVDWINHLKAAGQLVLGYVPVGNGSRPAQDVENGWNGPQGHLYGVKAWHDIYPMVSGIYFDEGPVDDGTKRQPNGKSTQDNYADYYALARTAYHFGAVMVEAAGYPEQWVTQVADYLIIWEGAQSDYLTNYVSYLPWMPPDHQTGTPPDWWRNPAKMIHTVTSASAPELQTVFGLASQRGAGAVYVTDLPQVGHMPVGFELQQALAGRPFALASTAFTNVHLRIDGRGVTSKTGSGGGTVNCQFGVDAWERCRLEFQADGSVGLGSDHFLDVYVRMDGRGVTAKTSSGGGTVNCQFGVDAWEKFRIEPQPDGSVALGSINFGNVHLRMDGRGVTAKTGSGGGTVNCQFGVDGWEKYRIELL